MSSWAAKQRMKYTLGFFAVLVLVSAYPVYSVIDSVLNKPPTCFDNIQNQNETGIDCGGGCELACVAELKDIQILWTRIFQLNENTYDLAAYVENPNARAGIRDIGYTFTVFDENGMELYKREGFQYINPREQFVVFEPNITIAGGTPAKVLFSFDPSPRWVQMTQKDTPITTKEKVLINEKVRPRINATINNLDIVNGYTDLDIIALVSDAKDNVVAASATYVESIGADEEKSIFLTWPTPFRGEATERACLPGEKGTGGYVNPTDIMLVFDRSGSMNDDGGEPVQPLADAKEAAQSFVDSMTVDDRIGLVSFATEASDPIDQVLSSNLSGVNKTISEITIGDPDHEQHTNLGDAIRKALEELTTTNSEEDVKSAIIILTDGIATRPFDPVNPENESYPEEYAAIQAEAAREAGISIHAIGLGNSINNDFLINKIASSEDHFYKATESEELKGIYADIATAVCREQVYTVDFFIRNRAI